MYQRSRIHAGSKDAGFAKCISITVAYRGQYSSLVIKGVGHYSHSPLTRKSLFIFFKWRTIVYHLDLLIRNLELYSIILTVCNFVATCSAAHVRHILNLMQQY